MYVSPCRAGQRKVPPTGPTVICVQPATIVHLRTRPSTAHNVTEATSAHLGARTRQSASQVHCRCFHCLGRRMSENCIAHFSTQSFHCRFIMISVENCGEKAKLFFYRALRFHGNGSHLLADLFVHICIGSDVNIICR